MTHAKRTTKPTARNSWVSYSSFRINQNRSFTHTEIDTYASIYPDGTVAHGGYSSHIRAHEHFTFAIPDGLQTELAAPMLCAGLTAYSPLVRNGVGFGKKVGIVGM